MIKRKPELLCLTKTMDYQYLTSGTDITATSKFKTARYDSRLLPYDWSWEVATKLAFRQVRAESILCSAGSA